VQHEGGKENEKSELTSVACMKRKQRRSRKDFWIRDKKTLAQVTAG
jgi:hypothetical protein